MTADEARALGIPVVGTAPPPAPPIEPPFTPLIELPATPKVDMPDPVVVIDAPAPTPPAPPPPIMPSLAAGDAVPFYKQAPFYITVLLMLPVYFVVVIVLWPQSGYTDSTRVQVVTAVLGLAALIGSFWLGTSLSSSKKDAAIQAAAAAPTTVVNNAAPSTAPTNINQ